MSQSSAISKLDGVALGGTCQLSDNKLKAGNGQTLNISEPPINKALTVPIIDEKEATGSTDLLNYTYYYTIFKGVHYYVMGSIVVSPKPNKTAEACVRHNICQLPKPEYITPFYFNADFSRVGEVFHEREDVGLNAMFKIDSNGTLSYYGAGALEGELTQLEQELRATFYYRCSNPFN